MQKIKYVLWGLLLGLTAWQGDGHITFLIKALDDYTRTLPDCLAVGHRHCPVCGSREDTGR